ncbi:TPA: 16S rRNA (uracil(1498)-N(3))-methyltransferase [Candidatus Avigastranaerophilus faecigallinarum]|nr:16S rRNA (uracil(1498)-N(3))-methyltransferase [Candidatus Avigastranaerophilus faecigallinarum]
MPHFLIEAKNIQDNKITVREKDLYQHIIKSLRAKIGENILFLDENEIQYETKLSQINSSDFVCSIEKKYHSNRKLALNLYVAQSVLNSDAQISSIQKATELGVKGIIPLHTDNCSVKESVIKNKIEKWQKIALESVKQCERADIPIVYESASIEDMLEKYEQVIVFAEKYAEKNFFDYIKENKLDKNKSILVIIGPEGGFSQREFDIFIEKKIPLITLGNLIYRADTALTAALTTIINGVQNE